MSEKNNYVILALEQRAETAEKACAEMRDFLAFNIVLDGIKLNTDPNTGDLCIEQDASRLLDKVDAGRDYTHKSKLDAALEALRKCIPELKEVPCDCTTDRTNNPGCPSCKALSAAEKVLKENQKENHETT